MNSQITIQIGTGLSLFIYRQIYWSKYPWINFP